MNTSNLPYRYIKFVMPSIDHKSTFPLDLAVSRGPCDLLELQFRPELRVYPHCRLVENRNFLRNRILKELSRKMIPEEAGNKEVAAQEREVIAAEEDVPEIRLPTIGFDVIFFIISLFWPNSLI